MLSMSWPKSSTLWYTYLDIVSIYQIFQPIPAIVCSWCYWYPWCVEMYTLGCKFLHCFTFILSQRKTLAMASKPSITLSRISLILTPLDTNINRISNWTTLNTLIPCLWSVKATEKNVVFCVLLENSHLLPHWSVNYHELWQNGIPRSAMSPWGAIIDHRCHRMRTYVTRRENTRPRIHSRYAALIRRLRCCKLHQEHCQIKLTHSKGFIYTV